MKRLRSFYLVGTLVLASVLAAMSQAKTITVNTTNQVAAAGQINLAGAIAQLADGDTINFNIPGAGPHYLLTPAGGYPMITKHNVILDGYSQPGAAPNTNPILAGNNARIRIVLDSRNGNFTDMAYEPDNGDAGFGKGEVAVLGIFTATNVTVRGFCLLGDKAEGHYGIAMARNFTATSDGAHVHGCWIGVDLDGKTVSSFADGIAAFRHRGPESPDRLPSNGHMIGVKPKSANPRAEFNVIVGGTINVIVEGQRHRISGNFLGVLPSGVNDYIVPFAEPGRIQEAHIEIGRGASDLVIGTDGDGVNDADERNIFGGVPSNDHRDLAGANNLGGYRHVIELYSLSSSPGPDRTNVKIAGNYIGLGVDGMTRFTNGVMALNGSATTGSQYWIGSDFDGVSDDIEGNVIYNNFPPGLFYQTPYNNAPSLGFFDEPSVNGLYSFRGNTLVNNYPFPVNPATTRDGGDFLNKYMGKVLASTANEVVPVLSNTSTTTKLAGTVPVAKPEFPTTMIDVYAPDPDGLANGLVVKDDGLTNGWVQGKKFLGSFVEGSADDLNPKPGEFEFNIASFGLAANSKITVAATYSQDPPRTKNGRAQTSPFSAPATLAQGVVEPFMPRGLSSANLTAILPDQIVFNTGADNLDNWEPFASVLGNSVFLVEANTFAEGTTDMQRYGVAFQPVAGGAPKLGEVFFADDGTPYKAQVNASRQNGNPGRVAGDKRPGAVNFIAGGEASPHAFPAFQSDNRWKTGVTRADDARYAAVQTFSLDPATLTQKALSKAFDAVNGRVTSGEPATTPEVGRFGGELAGLDNGNFVVVADDRSNLHATDRAATAVIVAPDGKIVKDTFVVANGQIWSNVAAHRGGFVVRVNATLFFYDNAGMLLGQTPQAEGLPEGVNFDGGRGDGTRLASHINSSYVYLAGNTTQSREIDGVPTNFEVVRIAVWDTRTRKLVAVTNVSELTAARGGSDSSDFNADLDRVNIAADALDRVTVTYEAKPTDYEQPQIVARVLAFDAATGKFKYLTPSFFPYANNATAGIRTFRSAVAMTTKQILIAGKGEVNSKNDPKAGPDSPRQTTVYTVISHPDPKDDPTPPVSQPLIVNVVESGGDNEATDTVTAKWTGVTFSNGVAGEFPNPFKVPVFGEDVPMFVDRNHQWNGASPTLPLPSYLVGAEYIMSGNDNRDNASYKLEVTVSAPALVYMLIDNRLSDGDGATPPTFSATSMNWVLQNGWTPVLNGLNRANNRTVPDEVGADEGGDGTINQWSSVYVKAVPAGTFSLLQPDNAGRNMYGAVVTRAPAGGTEPTFAKPRLSGNTLTLSWTGGGKLQESADITGPWTDVAGSPKDTFSVQTTGSRKFYRLVP